MANYTDDLLNKILMQMKITNVLIAEMTAPTRSPRPQWCQDALAEMTAKLGLDEPMMDESDAPVTTTKI